MRWRIFRGRCASIMALFALACASQAASGQTIEGAGATFPAPIYRQWFARFQQETGISVNYQAIGSGAGYNAIKARTVDFGASDAPLSAAEEAAMPGPVVHIPTVGGAVVLSYNLPGIGTGLRFTPEIIAGIYLGHIKSWNDPKIVAANPGVRLPNLPVHPVHRTDGSGTTYIFTHYLRKANGEWASSVGAGKSVSWPVGLGGKGNDGVAAVVRRTAGAIGYVELAYARENHLAYGQIRNRAGNFVSPSVESTTAAIGKYIGQLRKDIKTPTVDAPGVNSYPICSLTYIILYTNGGRNTAGATKLWSWAMQPTQQAMAKALYYAPLPEALARINLAHLRSVRGAQVIGSR
ncbi:MAG TPA: phosphate ABC transporter substrate-binding protein PstS [Chthonomonadaceae bacterium]|nr:phosphate ABC transporter substrate-binding protein PstS [Chthonomonadaceae bacterium]